MYKEKAIKILTDNTKYAKDDITKISDGSCGYSNTNFFVDLKDGKKFTIRVANYGKVHKDGKVLYDRENEYLVSTSLGKKYIYYNHKTGDFITNYINGICYELSSDSSAKAIAERNKVIYSKNYLTSSGKKLKKLHNCKITDKITQHNKFFGSNTDLYKKIIPLKYQDALEKIANKYQTTDLVPTHYDIGTQNIIYDKKTNNLEFIDFELSTVESKFWDIAYFLWSIDALINHDKERKTFLEGYGIKEISKYQRYELNFLLRGYEYFWNNFYKQELKMNKFLLSDMEKMFDYISTNNENVESFIIQSKHKLITGINFIIYDISIDSKVLVEIIKYFKKNKINYDDFDGYIKFRIATIEPKYIKKFNKQIENISSKEKTEIALSFDKQVTLPNLFGIGYEKDGMTPEGTKIRFAIRDMLLKISGLDKSVSITKDGWINPYTTIYGVYTKNKVS